MFDAWSTFEYVKKTVEPLSLEFTVDTQEGDVQLGDLSVGCT